MTSTHQLIGLHTYTHIHTYIHSETVIIAAHGSTMSQALGGNKPITFIVTFGMGSSQTEYTHKGGHCITVRG